MARSTAIVHVRKGECTCTVGVHRTHPHPLYVATCADCGWTATEHLRVILDAPYTGLSQQHRHACPAMTKETT